MRLCGAGGVAHGRFEEPPAHSSALELWVDEQHGQPPEGFPPDGFGNAHHPPFRDCHPSTGPVALHETGMAHAAGLQLGVARWSARREQTRFFQGGIGGLDHGHRRFDVFESQWSQIPPGGAGRAVW